MHLNVRRHKKILSDCFKDAASKDVRRPADPLHLSLPEDNPDYPQTRHAGEQHLSN